MGYFQFVIFNFQWNWLEAHQLTCLFKAAFGVMCPGCGFQTAVLLLLRGEIMESFKLYPGLFSLLAFLALAIGHFMGIKKIIPWMLKFAGFACLIIILISYLLKLKNH